MECLVCCIIRNTNYQDCFAVLFDQKIMLSWNEKPKKQILMIVGKCFVQHMKLEFLIVYICMLHLILNEVLVIQVMDQEITVKY